MSDREPEIRLRCPVCQAAFRTEFTCCPVDGATLAPPDRGADPLIGADIAGRYVLEELVGEGSMGLIYRARHVRLPRVFAIKILFGDLVADPRMRLRFAQEAALASRLSHPNVVPVVDFGRSERGLLYLVMDFVEGESLSDVISREAPLDPARVCRVARQLAEGLGHAHENGLVHRDFKPGNVILERRDDGEPIARILDFGLAISTREREEVAGRLTEFGFIVGTPIYIAPEQALDHAVDHRADLFALGVVMYEMLAGKPPFDGRPVEIAHKNVSHPAPRMAHRSPGLAVAPELERVVRRLLEKAPEQRYASGAELCAALDAVERGDAAEASEPVVVDTTAWAEPIRAPEPRPSIESNPRALPERLERWLAVGGAALGVAAVLGYGLLDRAGATGVPRPEVQAASASKAVAEQPHVAPLDPVEYGPPEPSRREARTAEPDHTSKPRARRKAVERRRQAERRDDVARPAEPPPGRMVAQEISREPEPEPAQPAQPAAEPSREAAMAKQPADSVPSDADRSLDRLVREYREVGEALDALQARQGEHAATPLRDRYFRLPYSDALRIPAVRRDTLSALTGLRQDVRRAMQRAQTSPRKRPGVGSL